MRKQLRTTTYLIFLFTIISACTKGVELKTEVEFEVRVDHIAEGYVDEGLSTNIIVTPEADLEDFWYTYSYSVSEGAGYFLNESGEKVAQNESIALNPFSASLAYIGTSAGNHSVKVIASNNYGQSKEVGVRYAVQESIVEEVPDEEPEPENFPKSNQNAIKAFAIPEQTGESIIDSVNYTISIDVPFGTELNVVPSILIVSDAAEVDTSDAGPRDFSNPVTYTIEAENGDTQQWTVTVTVGPKPIIAPVVEAGDNITISLPEDSVTLNGTAGDEDGTVTTEWTLEMGDSATITNPASLNTMVSGLTAGAYVFRLTATDDDGETDTDTVRIRVNIPPSADAGNSIEKLPSSTTSVTITGLADDVDGTFTVEWVQVEIRGTPATIVNPNSLTTEITGLNKGLNVFELIVTDNDGAVATDRMFVEVEEID
ncbi:MAG: TraQ conjugal transfer family protein [Pricia sp.]